MPDPLSVQIARDEKAYQERLDRYAVAVGIKSGATSQKDVERAADDQGKGAAKQTGGGIVAGSDAPGYKCSTRPV